MAYQRDPITDAILEKKEYARKCFNEKYNGKATEEEMEILSEVCYQIKACEELCCPVDKASIKDWICNGNIRYIERCARSIKFAS